jgi:hypothetical protein
VNKWLHALTGCAAVAAIAIVWNYWTWLGLAFAIALYLVSLLITAVVARFWLFHLLRISPESADKFMRDP